MPETREWSVPAPARTLLWWPAISFVLVVALPDAATGAIVVAGAALALLGGLLAAAARRLQRVRPERAADGDERPTVEMPRGMAAELPTKEIPQVDGLAPRRAA